MNKEEKEAIKELKEEINKPVELPEDKFDTFILFNIKSAKTVLNYIDKLQKENENLNKKNKRYEKYLKNKDIEHEKVLEYIETEKERDYISKDIIRNKIKELENTYSEHSEFRIGKTIEILNELLRG